MSIDWWAPHVRVANTASNAVYPVLGIGTAVVLGHPSAWAFAATMTVLGLGSAAYHWWGTPQTRNLDWFGMVFVLTGLAILAADPFNPGIWLWIVGLGLVVTVCLIYGLQRVGDNWMLGLLLGLVALPAMLAGPTPMWLAIASMGCFLIAKWFHHQDAHPTLGKYAHSIWHDGTGVAFTLMFFAHYVRP